MNRSRALASFACVAALTLAACGGDDDDATDTTTAPTVETAETTETTETTEATDTTEATETTEATDTTEATETTEATDTTDASATTAGDTPSAEPTAPGTELVFGDAAVIAIDDEAPDALVEMVVNPLRQGTPEELAELQVPDTVGGETLYYLELDITNVSAPETGGEYEPNTSFQILVRQADGEPAIPIINFVAFEPCDEEMVDDLAVGESYRTCLTYLAAPGQTVDAVTFSPDFSTEPITWRAS